MNADFEHLLQKYADLTIKVGLNLQPGQRLLVVDLSNLGVALEAAPLIRKIVASAYRHGARFVDVMWADNQVRLARYQYAGRDTFTELPVWMSRDLLEHVQAGEPLLTVIARDPDLLKGQDSELVAQEQRTRRHVTHPAELYIERNAINWCVVGAAAPLWAAKVFPDLPGEEATSRLWQAIFKVCRVDQDDPISAWETHIRELARREKYLNHKGFSALRYRGPGTDVTIGLPEGHVWASAQMRSETGILFTANLPTEEIFTLPHRERVEGYVTVAKPVSVDGTLVEDISLRFENGRVIEARAKTNEAILRRLIENDEGASHLGEVSLVPHSSPVSQSGVLFYNILFDENAASHIALGAAYRFSLRDGQSMSDDEFAAAGGNSSVVHTDLMIGTAEMDVDGLLKSGDMEPVMRHGEWAFSV